MSHYPHLHRDDRVGEAIQRLLDELVTYERATGRDYPFILLPRNPDGIPVCNYGGPIAPVDALRIAQSLPHASHERSYAER